MDLVNALEWQGKQQPIAAWGERYGGGFQVTMGLLQQSQQEAEAEELRVRKQKHKTIGILLVGLLLVSGLAGFSFIQWRTAHGHLQRAEENRQLAERQKELALRVISRFTYDIPELLERIPGTSQVTRVILEQNLASLERIYELAGKDADSERERSVNLNKVGMLWLTVLGDSKKALAIFQKSLEIRERLAASDPSSVSAQRDLSVSYNNLGNIQQSLGRSDEALGYYTKSLEISERLAASDPSSVSAQRDLSVSYEKMGDLQQSLGRSDEALGYYIKSLEIRERLVESDPSSVSAQRDLSVSYNKSGDVQQDLGRSDEALGYYTKSREIFEQLAASDPTSVSAQRDLSVSYNRLGNIQQSLGRSDEALGYYTKSLEIFKRLVDSDPTSVSAQRDLSVSYNKLGGIKQSLGRSDEALGYYTKSLEIRERLAASDPTSVSAQRDLSFQLWRIGNLKQAAEKYAKALQYAPENLTLLSDDMELAWVQGDAGRCRQRIAALDKLLKPEETDYGIVRFYAWLLNPEGSWQSVLATIKQIGEGKDFDWNFWATIPKVKQLPDRPRQAAEAFIEYFEGKSNLEELRKKLDALPKQAEDSPGNGQK
nr:tetratricopeptide repeat protein [Candidatus Electrothrix aestuarii]